MKKTLLALLVVGVLGGAVFAYYSLRKTGAAATVNTAPVTRGDVVDTVGATGTMQAVTTVQVGSQVSGNISWLGADFNSIVKKGQVIARLDPSLFEAQVQQARANLAQAQANLQKAQSDLERNKVQLLDAQQKYTRANELMSKGLLPQSDIDAAKTALDTAQAAVVSQQATITQTQAAITQAQASVNQNQVNLSHAVIEAPIDGLVISRNVDVGQTVAASLQAPVLFVLAGDLTKMQVVANLDESDVGRIRPGQATHFRVDAYPTEDFIGTVSQVRLQPIVQQNVVTYATVINVPNPELKLKPGMTANVNIEIARRTDVTRVPNAALRFRPTNEIFAALGQTPPEPGVGDGLRPGRGGSQGALGSSPAGTGAASGAGARGDRARRTADGTSGAQSGGDRRPGGGGAQPAGDGTRAAARDASATRDGQGGGGFGRGAGGFSGRTFGRGAGGVSGRTSERAAGGADSSAGRGGRFGGGGDEARAGGRFRGRGDAQAADADAGRTTAARSADQPQSLADQNPKATTIDALFGPLPSVESTGRVWQHIDNQLKPALVRLGISDGQVTELIQGELKPGDLLVTSVLTAGETTRPATTAFPAFLGGQQPRGGFQGGGGGGGGARGGAAAGGRGR